MNKYKSLRHIRRYRKIITTFSKYGLKNLASFIKFFRLPKKASTPLLMKESAINLRLALQELGPAFIKGGQLLSSRSDLLPNIAINELQKLLDEVMPVSFADIKNRIEEELNADINSIFNYIEEKPVASASLAQVYKAQLKNGDIVALKILRPGVNEIISTDTDIFQSFASILQDRFPYLKAYNLVELVREFKKGLYKEMDFELEGHNASKMAENLKEFKFIRIPRIYWQYTTKNLLCLEFIEGVKISQLEELKKVSFDRKKLASALLDVYSKQIYIDGFFQADPHIANILINKNGFVYLIDFGSIGKLDENMRKEISTLIFHFVSKDGEQATEIILRIGNQKPHTSYTAFRNDISSLIADYASAPPKYLSIGKALLEITRISSKHNVEIPAMFSQVAKATLLLDYLTRKLDPDFDYYSYLIHLTPVLLYENITSDYAPSRIARNVMESSKLISNLPAKISYFIDKVLKDEFHVVFQHEGLERISDTLKKSGYSIALSLVALGFSFTSILSFLLGLYVIAVIFGIVSLLLLFYLLYQLLRNINWQ